ncbi:hypothetical protein [Allorhodopirellula heiligendammensis]|uniref:Uncharacterized protein n=1 Tax=Allorhodopirellula heiligendammensis TaxID=2714739 RepID=A0A5C6BY41_9BACT|nr:hypothetical protein [Allorhodopirellula heiligendammensis]TWU16166.1 hypothetical protein Poly21_33710 [Allorhodopirellula heiligendammensis]
MTRPIQYSIVLFALTLVFVGCGGSGEPATTGDQDEITKWVEENPAPAEVDPDSM